TPAGRKNFRQMLSDNIVNRNRLLYELALSCAQVAQVEQFELVVPASANEANNFEFKMKMFLRMK
uniref:DUF58 domain-containing protein n=1 Tax=Meloidogyne hapla TaxID=6305 RepID=A0A1I8BKN6_MELHA